MICPTNPLCQQVTTALRSHGIPAFVRGFEYRLTPATMFIEGCAAWATLERESSNYRLGWLLRRWRTLLGAGASRSDDVALTALLMNYSARREERATQLVLDLLKLGLERALRATGARRRSGGGTTDEKCFRSWPPANLEAYSRGLVEL